VSFLCYNVRVTILISGFDNSKDKPDKIRIMLADDHPLLRQAIRYNLEKQTDFEIVAEVSDGEEAVRLAVEMVPDVVIMDISMPEINGLEATRQIKAKCPKIAILVLTVHDDAEHILSILEAGAAGYLTKRVFGNEVIQAIRGVATGDTILSPTISKLIIKYALRNKTKPVPLYAGEKITTRELEVLRLAAVGMSNKDIATTLEISQSTVKSYFSEIFSKLNVGSRTEAVIAALQSNIITLEDIK